MGKGEFFVYVILSGFLGMASNLVRAAFYTTQETLRSPNLLTFLWYNYCSFSFAFLLSFLVSPALLLPFGSYLKTTYGDVPAYVLPLSCLPGALLLYWLDFRLSKWSDARKERARERLRRMKRQP